MAEFRLDDTQMAALSQEEMVDIDGGGIIADAVFGVGHAIGAVLGWMSKNTPEGGCIGV